MKTQDSQTMSDVTEKVVYFFMEFILNATSDRKMKIKEQRKVGLRTYVTRLYVNIFSIHPECSQR